MRIGARPASTSSKGKRTGPSGAHRRMILEHPPSRRDAWGRPCRPSPGSAAPRPRGSSTSQLQLGMAVHAVPPPGPNVRSRWSASRPATMRASPPQRLSATHASTKCPTQNISWPRARSCQQRPPAGGRARALLCSPTCMFNQPLTTHGRDLRHHHHDPRLTFRCTLPYGVELPRCAMPRQIRALIEILSGRDSSIELGRAAIGTRNIPAVCA